jgi:O-antigen/teichoic acid export membrane protein
VTTFEAHGDPVIALPAQPKPRPQFKALMRAGGLMSRLGWGVGDQAVSSLTNFAVSIFVVHGLGARQFGAFSLAYVTYGLALNASRGLSTDPLMVRFSGVQVGPWRIAVRNCTGTALVVGIVTGLIAVAAGIVLRGTTGSAFLALGLTLPGLMLQDSWRFSFFALGRGVHAFVNDTIWAVTLLPALVVLGHTGHANVFWFTLAWGVTASIGAVAGIFQARVIPQLLGARDWLKNQSDLGVRYLLEGTVGSLVTQVRGFGTGLILGLSALGYLQASITLYGPMTILFLGMGLVTIPEAARVLRRSPKHLPLFCVLVSAGLSIGGVLWGAALLVAIPRGLGHVMLGHSVWRPVYPLIVPMMLWYLGQGVGSGAGTGLHGLGAAKRSLRVTIITSAITAGLTLGGSCADGVQGTAYGMVAGAWITSALLWWQFRKAWLEYGKIAADSAHQRARRGGRHRKRR